MPADLTRARADLQQQRERLLSQPFTPTRTSMTAPWTTLEGSLKNLDTRLAQLDALERSRNAHNRLVNIGKVASVAIPTAGLGLSAAGAGVAASAAPSVAAPVAHTAVGAGGMTFGNLLKLGELGAGLFTNVIGNRQQNRALDRDSLLRQQEFSQQMTLAQQQQAQAQKQWEAEQAQRAQEYALAIADRDRRVRLEDEREARRAPYRAMANQALMRFGDLLRLRRG